MQMQVEKISDDDGVTVYRLSGRITQQALRRFEDPLEEGGQDLHSQRVLFDMSKVEFVDSGGIGWLLKLHKRSAEHGGRLILYSVTPLVHNVLLVLRMNEVFELADNAQEAMALPKREESPAPKPQYKEIEAEAEGAEAAEGEGE